MTELPKVIESSDQVGAVATLADGRIATVFTAALDRSTIGGSHPAQPLYLRLSEDGGQTWSAPQQTFSYAAGKGAMAAPIPLVDRQGALHVFALRFYSLGWQSGNWHSGLFHIRSDNNGETWSEATQIDYGASYSGALNSAVQLTNGRILVPLSYLDEESDSGKFVCTVVYSDDGGVSWQRANDCRVDSGGTFLESGAIEPVVVQLNSGMVWMVIRTTTGYFWESFSNDGAVWTSPRPTRIVSSNAPAGVLRLHDGRILLVWNHLYGEPFRDGISYARQVLSAAVSRNDGQTWSIPKAVASRKADEPFKAQTTYPFLCQAPDGAAVLMYHRVYAQEERDWMHPIRELVRIDPDWLEKP